MAFSLKGLLTGILPKVEVTKFIKNIKKSVVDYVYKKTHVNRTAFKLDIKREIYELLQASPEVHALLYGNLRYDLGLKPEEVENIIKAIPDIVAESIEIIKYHQGDEVGFNFVIHGINYEQILALPDATFVQYNSRNPGSVIHWLEWLLKKGDAIVFEEYRVKYVDSPNSRSGGAWMLKGRGFSIPHEFAGTEDNNFITRALSHLNSYVAAKIAALK